MKFIDHRGGDAIKNSTICNCCGALFHENEIKMFERSNIGFNLVFDLPENIDQTKIPDDNENFRIDFVPIDDYILLIKERVK